MEYFKRFPLLNYDFTTTEDSPQTFTLADVSSRVQSFYEDSSVSDLFNDYKIKEGDRPEIISYKLYGTVDYYWSICYVNNIFDMYSDWPLNGKEIDTYAASLYPDLVPYQYPEESFYAEVKPYSAGTNTIVVDKTQTLISPSYPTKIMVGDFVDKTITGTPTNSAKISNLVDNGSTITLTLDSLTGTPTPGSQNRYTQFFKPIKKYDDIAYFVNERNVRVFFDENATYNGTIFAISYIQDLLIQNEKKRYIKVVKPGLITEFAKLYFDKVIK